MERVERQTEQAYIPNYMLFSSIPLSVPLVPYIK